MVSVRNISGRWIRRYKVILFIVIAFISLQLFLAVKFFALSGSLLSEKWQPQNGQSIERSDAETSVNAGGHFKEIFIDDEDAQNIVQARIIKPITKPNNTYLRLEELDFKPSCEIKGKEAISAIHRAKTQKCKEFLANITCLSSAERLYPQELKASCPGNGYKSGKTLGCFKDDKEFRLLRGYYGTLKKDNSPLKCVNLCLQSGFPFAGVQYSYECFCGSDEPLPSTKLPDSSCNMRCPIKSNETCGGYFTMNVYETGIKKFTPQSAVTDSSNSSPVGIVFLLTLNGRALRQIKRLLKIIYRKEHFYYIHVDVRQDYLFRELLYLETRFPNIKLSRNRFATIWGGASLLKMLLSCMKELLEIQKWQWDFVLNLSESDYPVKTIDKLTQFLSANNNKNFVKSHGREVQRFIQKQGLDKTFVECDTHMWRIGDRKLPNGIQVDGGSDWVALNRDFVRFVAGDNTDDLVKGLLKIFQYTLLPAESFFHTILRNSRFCNSYVDNNLHVTNWKRKLGCKCQYKHVVDWCGCSPNDFRSDDWSRIQNTETRQLYFARKFEPIISQSVIYQLELWLLGSSFKFAQEVSLHSYWQSVYHYHDLGGTVDDELLTIAHSAARKWIKSFNNITCSPTVDKIIEVTSYHFKDKYKFTLIRFNSSSALHEIAIKPLNIISMKAPLLDRLEYLAVSSEYDQKEQKSRNFARILSPFSDPVLIYQFAASPTSTKAFNISCLWVDPSGRFSDITQLSFDENNLTGFVKPMSLRQPHLPGTWAVKLIYNDQLLAEIKYLITPLEFFYGKEVTQSKAKFLHMGTTAIRDVGSYKKFLPNNFDRDILERLSVSNAKRFGHDLREWIDVLFSKFYTIEQVCGVYSNVICDKNVSICSETVWSSLSPDPKSAI